MLVAWNIGRLGLRSGPGIVLVSAALGLVILLLGAAGGLDGHELGVGREQVGSGLRYGGMAFAAVTLVLVAAALLPAAQGYFADERVHVSTGRMLLTVLFTIPIGTVLVEECAFRGTLQGLLRAQFGPRTAIAFSALLFGLWHISGIYRHGTGTVLGTVAATTLAGVGFGWLRERSGSLLAPMLAHTATNSVAFLVAWAVWR